MRLATGVRAHFGANINHLAIRALLIHTCEKGEHNHKEIGWGRVARSLDDIVLCDDDTVRVVYQGEISPAKLHSRVNPRTERTFPRICLNQGDRLL